MAMLQRLKHGKALCGKVFAGFVETFNWLVDFGTNLQGDGDRGNGGKIVVDRKDANHPVIRCKGCDTGSLQEKTLTVNHPDGTSTEYTVLADDDIEINESQGGGEIQYVDVVTGIEFRFNNGSIEFKLSKTKIATTSASAVSTNYENALDLDLVDVVTSVDYDANGTHKLTQTTTPYYVFESDESEDTTDVFEAVAHSEYGSDSGDGEGGGSES